MSIKIQFLSISFGVFGEYLPGSLTLAVFHVPNDKFDHSTLHLLLIIRSVCDVGMHISSVV